jgi:hypothetical protein
VLLKFVEDCRAAYDKSGDKYSYVRCVLIGAVKFARRRHLDGEHDRDIVWRATKALVESSGENEASDQWVTRSDIRSHAGFKYYRGSGLWPWRESQANVVERMQGLFRIRREFRDAMNRVIKEFDGTI